jgi:hypothetical protein
MTKYLNAFLIALVFVVILLITHYLHFRFFRVDVIFYAAALDALIASFVTGTLLLLSGLSHQFSGLERAQLVLIWLLTGYAFAISVPTVIDRSLSFYILEKLQQRGGAIKQSSFEEVFTKEYVKEHRLVDVRLTEQLESGTIEITNGCVRLTARGERLARLSRFYRQNLLPKQRLLMGQYSAALTDPFAQSGPAPDYTCR